MRLLRVQVPEFRVLKDVDITFEPDFTPAIFPLGSQNGGGKSTLLQLIFILLHCPFHPERTPFLKNLLQGFPASDSLKLLASFDLLHGDEQVNLSFFSILDKSARNHFELIDSDELKFSEIDESLPLYRQKKQLESKKTILENTLDRINGLRKDKDFIIGIINNEILTLKGNGLINDCPIMLDFEDEGEKDFYIGEFISFVQEEIDIYYDYLNKLSREKLRLLKFTPFVLDYLKEQNIKFICSYRMSEHSLAEDGALFVRISNSFTDTTQLFNDPVVFLNYLSNRIFMAAPSSQVFLFTSKESKNYLFQSEDLRIKHHPLLGEIRGKLAALYTYDFLVDLLIQGFKAARDQDFKIAIESGKYGESYQKLVSDLNEVLVNKKINVSPDLTQITFKLATSSGDVELFPEDLSHGELKRLGLYAWLKLRQIEDAIVLMDEVELAFHPDWQYQIVRDLEEWAPSNQYILATHSYELCQAVTPAHVKELPPKLLQSQPQA